MRYGQPTQRQPMFGGGTGPRQGFQNQGQSPQGYGNMRYRGGGQGGQRPPQPMPMPKQPEDMGQMGQLGTKPLVQDPMQMMPKGPMGSSGPLDNEGRPGAYLPPANPQSEGMAPIDPKPPGMLPYSPMSVAPKPEPTLGQRFNMMTQGAPAQSTISPGLVRPDGESFMPMRRPGMGAVPQPEVDPEELDARRRLFSIMR